MHGWGQTDGTRGPAGGGKCRRRAGGERCGGAAKPRSGWALPCGQRRCSVEVEGDVALGIRPHGVAAAGVQIAEEDAAVGQGLANFPTAVGERRVAGGGRRRRLHGLLGGLLNLVAALQLLDAAAGQ